MVDWIALFINLLSRWGAVWLAPLKNFELLWIVVPIYLSWLFVEFYQEKKGTHLGNAVTNGGISIWIGVDWARKIFLLYSQGVFGVDALFAIRLLFAIMMLVYGFLVVYLGVKGKKIVHIIGRIRERTYFALMATPFVYGFMKYDLLTIGAIFLFFPVFYLVVELIDRIVPNPKTYEEEDVSMDTGLKDIDEGGLGKDLKPPKLGGIKI